MALRAVMFHNTVRGSVFPEQHVPPCDSSLSLSIFVTVWCWGVFEQAERQVQCLHTLSHMTSRLHRHSCPLRYTLWPCMGSTSKDTLWMFRLPRSGEKGRAVFTQARLRINSSPANVIIFNLVYLLCYLKRWRLVRFMLFIMGGVGDMYENSRYDLQISALQQARSSPSYLWLSGERTLVSHMNVFVWRG